MAQAKTPDGELDDWIVAVDREVRRRTILDRQAASRRSGVFEVPLRFYFKVLEIGPVGAFKLAFAVLSGWVRRR